MQERTDEQLVSLVGSGNMPALAELVRRYQARALRLAYRTLGDWHLAEDVVQEGFLRVNRAAGRYRPDAKFGTWFYTIILNLCMDELRKRQRQVGNMDVSDAAGISEQDNPSHRYQVRELQQAVREAIDKLNEREKIAVILHRFEGLTHSEIAEVNQESISAVESVLVRAYRKLREQLGQFTDNYEKKLQGRLESDV